MPTHANLTTYKYYVQENLTKKPCKILRQNDKDINTHPTPYFHENKKENSQRIPASKKKNSSRKLLQQRTSKTDTRLLNHEDLSLLFLNTAAAKNNVVA